MVVALLLIHSVCFLFVGCRLQLNIPSLPSCSLSKREGETTVAVKLMKNIKSVEPVFGLSVVGYCRNMPGSVEDLLPIDIKGSF